MSTSTAQLPTDPFAAYGGKAIAAPVATGDPFSAYGGKAVAAAGPTSPAAVAPTSSVTDNPNSEGLYAMHSPDGRPVQIPYSKVHDLIQNGYLFQDKPTLQKYARDLGADPLSEGRIEKFLDAHPWVGAPVNALAGLGTGLLKTATGLDKTPTSKLETDLQLAAATPTKGPVQGAGEVAEGIGEFFTGDELLSFLGKAAKTLPMAERLKAMTNVAQLLEKHPVLATLAKIGSTAVKQGTISGAQTAIKSGGDMGEAGKTAVETGLASAALAGGGAGVSAVRTALKGTAGEAAPMVEKTAGGVKIPVPEETANAAATPTAAASAGAYSGLSQDLVREHLENLNVAPKLMDETISTTHDLTGAVERMQQKVLNPIYDNLNELTGGKFRTLNAEVQQAKSAARAGDPELVKAYQNKLKEMEDLLDQETGGLPKDYVQKVKQAWTMTNIVDDFAGKWDRNLNGTPGASQVSNEQRGINGNGLMKDIQQAVTTYGRDRVEKGLGAERLAAWENIARWNQTAAKRKAFNLGVQEVAQEMPRMSEMGKRAIAMTVGGAAAHLTGASPYMGIVAGEATYETTRMVMNALKSNPKIAQNFMFALESGAAPKRFGPFIAEMIQKSNTEASAQETRERTEGDQP